MTRPCSLWLSLAASTAVHALFAWQLSGSPRERRAARQAGTFEVRMIALPPPPVPPLPPLAPEPELPPPQRPVASTPKRVVKAPEAPAEPPPPKAAPAGSAPVEPMTAPAALLAETGAAGGGIVQLAGAPIGTLSTAAPPPRFDASRVTAPLAPRAASLAKLSDLSRKPKAPPLDAALRQNYPAELRRRGIEGQAEVRVVVDPRGRVAEIAIISESAVGFAEACRNTLVGSRWSEPLDRQGQPVSTRLTYRCRFQVER